MSRSYESWIYNYLYELESCSSEAYLIQHYVIKFVSDLRQIYGFHRISRFSFINRNDRFDITEILLNMALNNISLTTTTILNNIIY